MGRSGDGKRNILWGWPYHVYGRSACISADRNALLSPIEFISPGIKIGV